MAIFLDSQNLGYLYKRKKKKKVDFFFVAIKWTHGDGSKGNPQWFGFTNLNPKHFVIVVYMK